MSESNEILEAGEYCDRCLGSVHLGSWNPGPDGSDLPYTICATCWDDQDGMRQWFAKEIEEALASRPKEWERLPDGKWRSK